MTAALFQVAAAFAIARGDATTRVVNPAPAPMAVTVALYTQDTTASDRVGRRVRSIVAPSSFSLAPAEAQVIRIRLKESFPPGTVLRVVTTFTPAEGRDQPLGESASARIVVVTRLVTKAVVQ